MTIFWGFGLKHPEQVSAHGTNVLSKHRFALHRKVHRTSDETLRVSLMVQHSCLGLIATRRQPHLRPQNHFNKLTPAVARLLHHSGGLIHISLDHDSRVRAKMEIPELVAGGERSNQKLFRVPAGTVPAKRWV